MKESEKLFEDYKAGNLAFPEFLGMRRAAAIAEWGDDSIYDIVDGAWECSAILVITRKAAEKLLRKYLKSNDKDISKGELTCLARSLLELLRATSEQVSREAYGDERDPFLSERNYAALSQLCLYVADLNNAAHITKLKALYKSSKTLKSWFDCWHLEGAGTSIGEVWPLAHQNMMLAITGKTPDEMRAKLQARREKKEAAENWRRLESCA